MKKRAIVVVLYMAMTGAIMTGCGKEKTEDSDYGKAKVEENIDVDQEAEGDTQGGAGSDSDQDMITVGFAQAGEASDWRTAMTASMNDTFREANGYTLMLEDAGKSSDKQFAAVRRFVEEKVDYIVISTLLEGDIVLGETVEEWKQIQKNWEEVLKEAKEAEIPVILAGNDLQNSLKELYSKYFQRKLSEEEDISVLDESLYTAWVGSDYLQEGYDAADWLQEYLKSSGRNGETVQIAWASGFWNDGAKTVWPEDSWSHRAKFTRFAGFREWQSMEKLDHWEFLTYEGNKKGEIVTYGGYGEELTVSRDTLKKMLKKDKKIDVLVCENDQMALEAVAEIEKAGKSCGPDGDIIVISFGAEKAGLEAVIDGKINADIECSPLYGPYVEDIIKRLEAGDEVDKMQYVVEEIFTADNAASVIEKRMY